MGSVELEYLPPGRLGKLPSLRKRLAAASRQAIRKGGRRVCVCVRARARACVRAFVCVRERVRARVCQPRCSCSPARPGQPASEARIRGLTKIEWLDSVKLD